MLKIISFLVSVRHIFSFFPCNLEALVCIARHVRMIPAFSSFLHYLYSLLRYFFPLILTGSTPTSLSCCLMVSTFLFQPVRSLLILRWPLLIVMPVSYKLKCLSILMAVNMIKWCFELSTPFTFCSDISLYLTMFIKTEGYPDIPVYLHI